MNRILIGLALLIASFVASANHGHQRPQTVIIQNGYVISECYHNCYSQPHPSQYHRRGHGHRHGHHRGHGHRRPIYRGHGHHGHGGTIIQFGIGVTDHRGSGFNFGFSQHR